MSNKSQKATELFKQGYNCAQSVFAAFSEDMVYELVKLFDKPFGVVLNKCLPEENPSEQFCIEHDIKILAKIPYDEKLGSLNSNGHILVREDGRYRELFESLLLTLRREAVS